jgi:serine/threonine-protein kinase RsbW
VNHAEPARVLHRDLPAVATSVREARAAAVDFAQRHCDADAQLLSDIALCVSEAAGNVVVHAYGDAGGQMRLSVHQTSEQLVVEISDQGAGISAGVDPPGLGLGVPIVQALSDATIDRSTESGHRVTMRFRCHPR